MSLQISDVKYTECNLEKGSCFATLFLGMQKLMYMPLLQVFLVLFAKI